MKKIILGALLSASLCSLLTSSVSMNKSSEKSEFDLLLANDVGAVFSTSEMTIQQMNISYENKGCSIYRYDIVAINSKIKYNNDTYSILDTDYYQYSTHNSSTNLNDYVILYMNETPVEGAPITLGYSEGNNNTCFDASYSVDKSYSFGTSLSAEESVEAEVFGNTVTTAIKQSVSFTNTSGTTNAITFTFSYDEIKNDDYPYYATLTPYTYKYVCVVYKSYKKTTFKWGKGFQTSKGYTTYNFALTYNTAIKKIEVSK